MSIPQASYPISTSGHYNYGSVFEVDNKQKDVKLEKDKKNDVEILIEKDEKQARAVEKTEKQKKELFIDAVAKLCLTHFKEDPKIPNPPLGDAEKFVIRQRELLTSVGDQLKRKQAFEILKQTLQEFPKLQDDQQKTLIDIEALKDLGLLIGSDGSIASGIAEKINKYTSSEAGKAFLLHLIATPTTDSAQLLNRQTIIKSIQKRSKQIIELEAQFKGLDDAEAQMLSFWESKLQLPGCMNSYYFKLDKTVDDYCNGSSLLLDVNAGLMSLKKVTSTSIQVASSILLPLYSLSLMGLMNQTYENLLKEYNIRFMSSAAPLYSLFSLIPNNVTKGAIAASAGILSGIGVRSAASWNFADFRVEAIVQNKLVKVAGYYRRMKAIYKIVSSSPELRNNLSHFNVLEKFFEDKKLQPLFSLLESRTFNSEASYFFRRGNVLNAWNLLAQEKMRNKFRPAMAAIAEIDAYLAISKFVEVNKGNVCFSKYLKKGAPELSMRGFTHPLVTNHPVPNTIELGETNYNVKSAIVTGPNATGKSTLLKCASLIVLAQTLGISIAESMELTPFKFIGTSMNIADNLTDNKSGLQAQASRVAKLVDTMESLKNGEFSFCALDELFTQTTEKEGSALSMATVSRIHLNPDNLSIVVSHDPNVANLKKDNSAMKNFKLTTDADKRPLYSLVEGTSDTHIALQVASAQGMKVEIIDHAKELLKRLQQK